MLYDASNLEDDRVKVGAVWRPEISRGLSSHVAAAEWSHGHSGPARYQCLLELIIFNKPDIVM